MELLPLTASGKEPPGARVVIYSILRALQNCSRNFQGLITASKCKQDLGTEQYPAEEEKKKKIITKQKKKRIFKILCYF